MCVCACLSIFNSCVRNAPDDVPACVHMPRLMSSGSSTTPHCTVGLFNYHLPYCTNDQIEILLRLMRLWEALQIRSGTEISLSHQVVKSLHTHLTLQKSFFFPTWKPNTWNTFHENEQDILGHYSKEVTTVHLNSIPLSCAPPPQRTWWCFDWIVSPQKIALTSHCPVLYHHFMTLYK